MTGLAGIDAAVQSDRDQTGKTTFPTQAKFEPMDPPNDSKMQLSSGLGTV